MQLNYWVVRMNRFINRLDGRESPTVYSIVRILPPVRSTKQPIGVWLDLYVEPRSILAMSTMSRRGLPRHKRHSLPQN